MEILGIPKEIKTGEARVALTPRGVAILQYRGVTVLVEDGAGKRAGFSNEDYEKAGAKITSREELWKKSTLIKKVKEPIEGEFQFLRKDLSLFTFLHLAAPEAKHLTKTLLSSQTTSLAYETLEVLGYTPILKPMSLIAGTIAGFLSGLYRHSVTVKDGKIISDPGIRDVLDEFQSQFPVLPRKFNPGRVVVLGGGQVGIKAAETAMIMGGEVTIYEINLKRCHYLRRYFDDKVRVTQDWEEIKEVLKGTDVIIGGVYVRARQALILIDDVLLKEVSKKHPKLILDVAADQGGNIAGSHVTTWQNPLFLDAYGNLRFGVSNLPALCPRYASLALEDATLDYTIALAKGLREALKHYPEMITALSTFRGKLLQREVAQIHGLEAEEAKKLISSL